jgi:hypothetical protein
MEVWDAIRAKSLTEEDVELTAREIADAETTNHTLSGQYAEQWFRENLPSITPSYIQMYALYFVCASIFVYELYCSATAMTQRGSELVQVVSTPLANIASARRKFTLPFLAVVVCVHLWNAPRSASVFKLFAHYIANSFALLAWFCLYIPTNVIFMMYACHVEFLTSTAATRDVTIYTTQWFWYAVSGGGSPADDILEIASVILKWTSVVLVTFEIVTLIFVWRFLVDYNRQRKLCQIPLTRKPVHPTTYRVTFDPEDNKLVYSLFDQDGVFVINSESLPPGMVEAPKTTKESPIEISKFLRLTQESPKGVTCIHAVTFEGNDPVSRRFAGLGTVTEKYCYTARHVIEACDDFVFVTHRKGALGTVGETISVVINVKAARRSGIIRYVRGRSGHIDIARVDVTKFQLATKRVKVGTPRKLDATVYVHYWNQTTKYYLRSRGLLTNVGQGKFSHTCSTVSGCSGAGLMASGDVLLGVHTEGFNPGQMPEVNSGVWIFPHFERQLTPFVPKPINPQEYAGDARQDREMPEEYRMDHSDFSDYDLLQGHYGTEDLIYYAAEIKEYLSEEKYQEIRNNMEQEILERFDASLRESGEYEDWWIEDDFEGIFDDDEEYDYELENHTAGDQGEALDRALYFGRRGGKKTATLPKSHKQSAIARNLCEDSRGALAKLENPTLSAISDIILAARRTNHTSNHSGCFGDIPGWTSRAVLLPSLPAEFRRKEWKTHENEKRARYIHLPQNGGELYLRWSDELIIYLYTTLEESRVTERDYTMEGDDVPPGWAPGPPGGYYSSSETAIQTKQKSEADSDCGEFYDALGDISPQPKIETAAKKSEIPLLDRTDGVDQLVDEITVKIEEKDFQTAPETMAVLESTRYSESFKVLHQFIKSCSLDLTPEQQMMMDQLGSLMVSLGHAESAYAKKSESMATVHQKYQALLEQSLTSISQAKETCNTQSKGKQPSEPLSESKPSTSSTPLPPAQPVQETTPTGVKSKGVQTKAIRVTSFATQTVKERKEKGSAQGKSSAGKSKKGKKAKSTPTPPAEPAKEPPTAEQK